MKFIFMTILSFLVYNSGIAQTSISTHEDDLVREFMAATFDTLNDKESIPKPFLKHLNKDRKEKIIFANSNESVSVADPGTKNVPNATIVFLGKSKDDLYVLIYDDTGYAASRKGYLFAVVGKGVVTKLFILNSSVHGVNDMKRIFSR
jgi:hypothetical protein